MKYLLIFFTIILSALTAWSANWDHKSEIGVILISGNNVSRTENGKHESSISWQKNTIKIKGQALQLLISEKTVSTWGTSLRFERIIKDKLSYFIENSWSGDSSAGYDYRADIDLGGQYLHHKTGNSYLLEELGYRLQYEKTTLKTAKRKHFLRFYLELSQGVAGNSFDFWVEVLPNLLKIKEVQANYELSFKVNLSGIFSLKIGYLYKYNSMPAVSGLKTVDTIYTTTFMARY